jgi:hypothetical protein
MSYSQPCGSIRVRHFSNPDVDYFGEATGISHDIDPLHSADNARAMNDTAAIVAAYRDTQVDDVFEGFDDVPADHWAFSYIEDLAVSGITSGCGEGNFCPNAPITRAQLAVFLERGMNGADYAPPAPTGRVFLDVSQRTFAANYIEQLARDGVTVGCGNSYFCPDGEVTRAQMAVLLLKAKYGSHYIPEPATGRFVDVSRSNWAASWIEQLAAEGVTSGCDSRSYCPNDNVTRAQMAVFLVRIFELD